MLNKSNMEYIYYPYAPIIPIHVTKNVATFSFVTLLGDIQSDTKKKPEVVFFSPDNNFNISL